ncbi:MAG: hypothetical protein HY329_08375, partial [Chloroflexi bacterium]|nr:hypothetical protein [Chloroflexota bacterium]
MGKAAAKNNALRRLEAAGVVYEAFEFSPELHSATAVASVLGIVESAVYKTIVVLRERGRPLLVMLAGDREIDPKALAKSLGEKRLEVASKRAAERLTGLQVGGISALALLDRNFEPCLDGAALQLERLYVNGGRRGLNVRVAVADLIKLTNARIVTRFYLVLVSVGAVLASEQGRH